ncbi:molybdopterin molybdotransferase MoeA [Streptomyces odontomachi]|uniref:molybdopterin molybdotransferase MoeA n=1 Tax=Streptomyces odontomachi TaxID=2944940 RepID=UPI0035A99557
MTGRAARPAPTQATGNPQATTGPPPPPNGRAATPGGTASAGAPDPSGARPRRDQTGSPGHQAPPTGHHDRHGRHRHRHDLTPWPQARAVAEQAGRDQRSTRPADRGTGERGPADQGRLRPVRVPLDQALGRVTAAPLIALTDLPSFDTSAMDGWAVAGPGPWLVQGGSSASSASGGATGSRGQDGPSVPRALLAGHALPDLLGDGQAVPIATGARIPHDATAVIRNEHGQADDRGRLYATHPVVHGQDIRPRGQECRRGDRLLPAGVVITPVVLGLAAAAGYDGLLTVPLPRTEVFVLGDELLTEGLPHDGLIRDALGPMLPPWLRALGAEVTAVRRLGDDARALHRAVTESDADLLVTTGGTAAGPVDHVHPTLRRIDAELLVDGVAVRPGHPMLLARTKEHQHLVGLPGNPLAAVSGLLTLAEPLLRALRGLDLEDLDPESSPSSPPSPFVEPHTSPHSQPQLYVGVQPARPYTTVVSDSVQGHPHDTRLVPVAVRDGVAVPLHYNGPAMLRGIAAADALAVVEPGGAQAGEELEILELPWATS